jgi:uncharacterized protein YutE (UPF0331/DUF86 family)
VREEIQQRFDELQHRGYDLCQHSPSHENRFYTDQREYVDYFKWLSSAAHLLRIATPSNSYFHEECIRIMADNDLSQMIPMRVVQKMYSLLAAARAEWQRGLLHKVEYVVAAATFDDFLDHAAFYHRGNKKTEAAVLASAVLEDTVKKIASKHGITVSGLTLDPLIDELVKVNVFTLVKAKRVKGAAAVRNHALHAEWDQFDIRDVGDLIKNTRELIEEFL